MTMEGKFKINLFIFLLTISLIFSNFKTLNAGTEVNPEDEYEEFSQVMSPNLPYFEKIKGNEGGNGCYFRLESNMSITISVVNSTNREHIAEDEKWESLYDFWERENLYFEFILPYDDDFYIVMYNRNDDGISASVNGYMAKDITFDSYEIVGTYDGDHIQKGEEFNFSCRVDNRFGLKNATYIIDGDLLEEFVNEEDMDMINDTITLNYTIYPQEIRRYEAKIILYDYSGNKVVHVMDIVGDDITFTNETTTTTEEGSGFDFDVFVFFEENFIIILAIVCPLSVIVGLGVAYVTEEK